MKNTITLALSDISAAGSIAAAIEAHCAEHDSICSGQVGPSFATSGPGPGWSRNYSARDYAARALSDEHGALAYIDSNDGRLAELDEDGKVVWSAESAVEVVAPDESAIESDPATLSLMLDALESGHCVAEPSKCSRKAWDTLRALATEEAARKAAAAL